MSFEPETRVCQKCQRTNCWDGVTSIDRKHNVWTCKCGHQVVEDRKPKPPAEWMEALAKDLLQVVLFADPDRMPFSFEGALEIIQRHAPKVPEEHK